MTRSAWLQLPEREREAIRQASAEASLHDFAPRRAQSDWDRTREVWEARDAYRVETIVLGVGLLVLLTIVSAIAGLVLR